jgi:hypothetical protein
MTGQQGFNWWVSNTGVATFDWDIYPNSPGNVMVETAINRVNDISPGDGVFGEIGIVHIHSNSGTEDPHYAPVLFRRGTTHVRVEGLVDNTFINVRVMVNYW